MMSLWQTFFFREPGWLLLCLQPLILIASATLLRRFRRDEYADAKLLPWAKLPATASLARRLYPQVFLLLAWIAFAIALAGPRHVDKIIDTDSSRATEVIVVFDLSHSMAARDVLPSRIERAKIELNHFVQQATGLRIGLVVYAAQPHLISPATTDKNVLQHYISSLHTRLLPTEGSDLAAALTYSAKQFHTDVAHARALLLLSDGEANLVDTPQTQILKSTVTALAQQNIKLFILGVGTTAGAAILDKDQGWLQHQGQAVITRQNSELLSELATLGNGRYISAVDGDNDWLTLYNRGIALLTPHEQGQQATGNIIVWQEQYPVYLLFGVFFLFMASWQLRRRRVAPTTSKPAVYGALLLSGLLLTASDHAYANEATLTQAYRAYQQADYATAGKIYRQLPGYAARMGEGSTAYQRREYKIATMQFIQATLDAHTDQQRAEALFNLANSYYKLQAYAQAIPIYQDVLRYQADFAAAKINLSYAQDLFQQQRTEEITKAQRAGRGVRSGLVAEGTSINQSRVELDDTPVKQEITAVSPTTSVARPADTTEILRQTQPAADTIEKKEDKAWTYTTHRLEDIQRQATLLQHDESIFWQRLFEQEENFPAPVITPHVVPQVLPW